MIRFGAIFLILAGFDAALAADYCSLIVRVLSPDERRPLEVVISIREKGGRVIEKETTSEDVRFCDLGIMPVTVTVGIDTCNQVVIRDVPLAWEEEYLLRVTYDPEPCMQDLPPAPVPFCRVVLRISDPTGKWIEKAAIRFRQTQLAPRETDRAGRALVVLKAGDRVAGVVEGSGYASKSFLVSCSRSEPVQELPISLERTTAQ